MSAIANAWRPRRSIALGPSLPDVKPLGETIRIRIDLKGFRVSDTRNMISLDGSDTPGRRVCYVQFRSITGLGSYAQSSCALEGEGLFQGIVQWNEALWIDCLEFSYINVSVWSHRDEGGVKTSKYTADISVADFVAKSKVSCWLRPPNVQTHVHLQDVSYLLYTASSVIPSDGEHIRTSKDCTNAAIHLEQSDIISLFQKTIPTASLEAESTRENRRLSCTIDSGAFALRIADSRGVSALKLDSNSTRARLQTRALNSPSVSNEPAGVLSAGLRRLPHFLELAGLSNTPGYSLMFWMYKAYQILLTSQSYYDPQIDEWQSAIMEAMDAVMRLPQERIQCRRDDIQSMVLQLWAVANCMYGLLNDYPDPFEYSYVYISDLARLVHIITAPDPTSGTASVSASANQHTVSRAVVKDTLLLALEAIVQSSDAFPPLKSAASGLLFFATYAEMASSNKKQIREIYKRVDGLVDSLKHGMNDGAWLSPAHEGIVNALAKDIAALQQDMEDIVTERKSRFKRYLRAKRHREELQDVVWQLDNARLNYITAVATLNATTVTKVYSHVEAISLVLNTRPRPVTGTHGADAVVFPFGAARIQEA